jgi:dCMP deaminase
MSVKTKENNWNKYFMDIAIVVRTRSDCLTRSVGAVLVNKNHRIIATGYNGAPKGIKNCNEGGCERCLLKSKGKIASGEQLDKCICVHAEENAVIQAANEGISTNQTVCYCTNLPCVHCTKILIQGGIIKVYYKEDYDSILSIALLKEAKIKLVKLT